METYEELMATAKAARVNAAHCLKYAEFLESKAAKLAPAKNKRMSESAKAGRVIRKCKAAQQPHAVDLAFAPLRPNH